MNTIGERIKEIRLDHNLKQDKFGEKIGLKKSALSLLERNERSLTDAVEKNLLEEFSVNKLWLQTGTGEKYNTLLKNKKELFENEINFMSAALAERQLALLDKVQFLDEAERIEILTALEEIYSILSIPMLKKEEYFIYYESIAGMICEMNRYIGVINDVKLSKEKVYNYIKTVQKDLLSITKIFIPEIDTSDDPVEDTPIQGTNLSSDEKELIDIFRDLDENDKEEIIAIMKLKNDLKGKSKKKQTSFTSAQDEEAAVAQYKIG